MKTPILFLVVALSAIFIFSSCGKDDIQIYTSRITVENYSDWDLDSLEIYTSSSWSSYSLQNDSLIFRDLKSGGVTEQVDFYGLEIFVHFRAYIDDKIIRQFWAFPTPFVDPARPIYAVRRNYHFGIVEVDTATGYLEVGLMDTWR